MSGKPVAFWSGIVDAGPAHRYYAKTLQWLASQAAVAIVNARLFQQSDLVAEMVHELRDVADDAQIIELGVLDRQRK